MLTFFLLEFRVYCQEQAGGQGGRLACNLRAEQEADPPPGQADRGPAAEERSVADQHSASHGGGAAASAREEQDTVQTQGAGGPEVRAAGLDPQHRVQASHLQDGASSESGQSACAYLLTPLPRVSA